MIDAISNALAEPHLAFGLYIAGTLAILYEVFKPGSIFPGVAGGAMVVGAILASRVLPVRPVAVFGIAVGLGLLAAEVYVRSRGVLALVGLTALVTSGLHLIALGDGPGAQPPSPVVVAAGSLVAAFAILVGGRRIVGHAQPAETHSIQLLGQQGEWRGNGLVRTDDAVWRAESASPIAAGTRVLITGAHGFVLTVVPLDRNDTSF
jgi:membrane-bound serine protease (ClpP class)